MEAWRALNQERGSRGETDLHAHHECGPIWNVIYCRCSSRVQSAEVGEWLPLQFRYLVIHLVKPLSFHFSARSSWAGKRLQAPGRAQPRRWFQAARRQHRSSATPVLSPTPCLPAPSSAVHLNLLDRH